MKNKLSLIGLITLLLSVPADAQILKKLGQRAEQAAERTILNRTDKEVSKGTDKAIDGMLEGGKKKDAGKAKGKEQDKEKQNGQAMMLPSFFDGGLGDARDTYTFSHRVTMKMTTGKKGEEINMHYWLEREAPYFGSQLSNEGANQLTVIDLKTQGMVMFMDDGKQKMAMGIKGNQKLIDKYIQQAAAEENTGDVKLTPIGSKTILGYSCKGFRTETDDGVAEVWITDEAPVGSIAGVLQGDRLPSGALGFGSNALLMEMVFIPHKKKKDQLHMVCTDVKAMPLVINKADFQSIVGR